MVSKVVKTLFNKAREEKADLGLQMYLPDKLPAAKITIEQEGQEPIVIDSAGGFVVYADMDGKGVMGVSAGHVGFFCRVIMVFQEKVLEIIDGKIPALFTVPPGDR